MFSTRKHYPDSVPTSVAQLALTPECCFLSGEATHTNFKVFGLTRPVFEPTMYSTQGDHCQFSLLVE